MESEKKLFRAEIIVMLHAENETKARKQLLNQSLSDEIAEADICETNSVPSEWYDSIPYGCDEDLTCGEILRCQREEKS